MLKQGESTYGRNESRLIRDIGTSREKGAVSDRNASQSGESTDLGRIAYICYRQSV